MNTITINGVEYTEREKSKSATYSIIKMMSVYLAMMSDLTIKQTKSLKGANPDVNIIWEFELIQQKKSNLQRSQRDWVIREFNKRFKAI